MARLSLPGKAPRRRPSFDWPLSQDEKKTCTIGLYERDVRVADELLRSREEALGALETEVRQLRRQSHASARELKALRRLSASSAAAASATTGRGSWAELPEEDTSSDASSDDDAVGPLRVRVLDPEYVGAEPEPALSLPAPSPPAPPWPSSGRRTPLPPWPSGRAPFGASAPWSAAGGRRPGPAMLRPSLTGRTGGGILPVQEFHTSESAVCCMCFGDERFHKSYVLLAAGFEDGHAVLYRCYRTEMERSMLLSERQLPITLPLEELNAFVAMTPRADGGAPLSPTQPGKIAVHSSLLGHAGGVTSIFFGPMEDTVATLSMDNSLRLWDVDTGGLLQVFTDTCAFEAGAFVPLRQELLVAVNARGLLRVIDTTTGATVQRLRLSVGARALAFDATGEYLFAGCEDGSVHTFDGSAAAAFRRVSNVAVAQEEIQSMASVSEAPDADIGRRLVVRTAASICVLQCDYRQGGAPRLLVLRRLPVDVGKTFFSPSGLAVCCTEDDEFKLVVKSLQDGSSTDLPLSQRHARVRAAGANKQNTMIASGDALGRIVLWRRLS